MKLIGVSGTSENMASRVLSKQKKISVKVGLSRLRKFLPN